MEKGLPRSLCLLAIPLALFLPIVPSFDTTIGTVVAAFNTQTTMPAIKGTASVEDSRAYSKAMRSTKFPAIFQTPIADLRPVNRAVMEQWISTRITALLGFEDEIVEQTATNLFVPEPPPSDDGGASMLPITVDPRRAQIDLAGFLGEESAASFAAELWELLLDAVKEPTGIPRKLLEAKKQELAAKQEVERPQTARPERRPPPQGLPPPRMHDRRGRDAGPPPPRRVEDYDDRYEQHRDGRWNNYRNDDRGRRGGWNNGGYGRGGLPPPDYYGRPPHNHHHHPAPDHPYHHQQRSPYEYGRNDDVTDRRRGEHDRRPPPPLGDLTGGANDAPTGGDGFEYDEYGRRTRYRGDDRRGRDANVSAPEPSSSSSSRRGHNRHRHHHRRRRRRRSRSSSRGSCSSSSTSSASSSSSSGRSRRRRSRS